jgi:hypothetical protein
MFSFTWYGSRNLLALEKEFSTRFKLQLRLFLPAATVVLLMIGNGAIGRIGAEERTRNALLVVAQEHVAADDANAGTEQAPLRTIAAAVARAQAGDTIFVHRGIYREQIKPTHGGEDGRPLVFRAAAGESVVVRGSDEITAWEQVPGHPRVFATPVARLVPVGAVNPYLLAMRVSPGEKPGELSLAARPVPDATHLSRSVYLPRTLGLVFAGGQPLREVTSENAVFEQAMTWIVSADGERLLVNFGRERLAEVARPIEVAVRPRLFAPVHRGLGWIEIHGFDFEHCANPGPFPQAGAVAVRGGHHWTIAGNTIRWAKSLGLDLGNEHWNPERIPGVPLAEQTPLISHHLLVEDNTVSDNGICGITGHGHRGSQVRRNLVERNGWLDLDETDVEWAEWAGIKFHGDALVEANVVRDNEGYGIWLDNIRGGRITRNLVLSNKGVGIFTELGSGLITIDNNIVAMTRWMSPFYDGTGIYAHDVSGLLIAHNLVLGSAGAGIELRVVSERKLADQVVSASGSAVLNNILLYNSRVALSLPFNDARAENIRSDWNVLVGNQEYYQGQDSGWDSLCAINRFALTFSYEEVRTRANALRTEPGFWSSPPPPLPSDWCRRPVLDLVSWQRVRRLDQHSRELPGALKVLVRSKSLALRLDHDGRLSEMACPAVSGITLDFFGRLLATDGVFPGPFQQLEKGRQEFTLPSAGALP